MASKEFEKEDKAKQFADKKKKAGLFISQNTFEKMFIVHYYTSLADKRNYQTATEKGHLNNKIKKLKKNKLEIIIIKIKDNLSENEAFKLEKNMITLIGRLDRKKGTLLNATDGGEGPAGKILSIES